MQKKIRGLNSVAGTLMSGLEIQHNKQNGRLTYPGAANAFQDVSSRAMLERLKEKKSPGFLASGIATQYEIEDFINNHEKANEMKEEIAFNDKRRKANKPALLGLAPAGAAIGAALPMAGAGALEAVQAKKGQILNSAMKGAKAMITPEKVTDMNSFASKYAVPLIGASAGLLGGAALAGKLNGMHRNKVVGEKRDQALNDISYDLDKYMRNKETIKRIADNSTFEALENKLAADESAMIEKEAKEKKRNIPLRAVGAAIPGALIASNIIAPMYAAKEAKSIINNGGVFSGDPMDLLKGHWGKVGVGAAVGAGLAVANSVRKNLVYNASYKKAKGIEKKAGYKRDLRIARAEAKAKNPRLTTATSPEEVKKYQKEMAQYGDAIESFLNSSDRKQDWETKKKMARLSIERGESSKNISVPESTKSFINKRIVDKHSNGNLNIGSPSVGDPLKENILNNHPDFIGRQLRKPSQVPTTPEQRLKNIKKGTESKEQYVKLFTRSNVHGNDSNLAKQLESGRHNQKRYSTQDLRADGVYFKTHSESKPFDLAGFDGTHIKRNFTGKPTAPKKGIPIWASKLPEVSTTYGDTVLAFKPNEAMLAGASPIDHPHLAKDTRFMNEKQIGKVKGWNQVVDLNRHPEYERVFTYNRKNMDKSTVATYSKHRIGKGNKFDQDAWEFVKNKPGSLADRYARNIANGPQDGYASAKRVKQLDRKALKRRANEILSAKPGEAIDMSAINAKHQLPSKARELAKNEAFRKNMLLATGGLATAGLVGYNAYKAINDAKKKRDFLKQKEKEEKTASQVHHELMIEKMAIRG